MRRYLGRMHDEIKWLQQNQKIPGIGIDLKSSHTAIKGKALSTKRRGRGGEDEEERMRRRGRGGIVNWNQGAHYPISRYTDFTYYT